MVAHPSTTISPSSAAGATAPESLLARYISAHVRKGEQAEERANQAREKAEQHFIAAGARQIIENVTGFFSILHEWSRAENPRAGNDSRERLAAVRHGAPRLSTSKGDALSAPKRGRRPPTRPDTPGGA